MACQIPAQSQKNDSENIMGRCRLRRFANRVIESEFEGGKGSEAVRCCHDAAGGLRLSPESIQGARCHHQILGHSPAQANAVQQVLEPRVGTQRVEAGTHEYARVKALRIGLFEPGHGLILVAQSYIDQCNLRSV